ncbi:outer membrane protein, OmpA/MotB family [Candidatus Paraburkholderia calva]|nr:outer membrane protein, OmpA/MotB family [Candidatus Paraburkholderia calva]
MRAGEAQAVEPEASELPLRFEHGAHAALTELTKTAHALKECGSAATPIKLQIAGFSDNTGGKALNLRLSKQRAEAVRTFMIKHGVPVSALVVQGFGDAQPIADNKTVAGRQANRRVELTLVD